jgi:ABC-type sulfate transport system permease subunit
MKTITKISAVLALLGLVLMPALSFAQVGEQPAPIIATDVGATYSFLNRIINIMFSVLMILAVIFIMVAAFNYLTAGGNAEKVETAGRQILYAIIAIVIAVLARSVPFIIKNFLTSGGQ